MRSSSAHEAIVDAIRGAMTRNRLDATAGDLIAAILTSRMPIADFAPGHAFNLPAQQVIRCADRAAETRREKTTLSDLLQCLIEICSDELREHPSRAGGR